MINRQSRASTNWDKCPTLVVAIITSFPSSTINVAWAARITSPSRALGSAVGCPRLNPRGGKGKMRLREAQWLSPIALPKHQGCVSSSIDSLTASTNSASVHWYKSRKRNTCQTSIIGVVLPFSQLRIEDSEHFSSRATLRIISPARFLKALRFISDWMFPLK